MSNKLDRAANSSVDAVGTIETAAATTGNRVEQGLSEAATAITGSSTVDRLEKRTRPLRRAAARKASGARKTTKKRASTTARKASGARGEDREEAGQHHCPQGVRRQEDRQEAGDAVNARRRRKEDRQEAGQTVNRKASRAKKTAKKRTTAVTARRPAPRRPPRRGPAPLPARRPAAGRPPRSGPAPLPARRPAPGRPPRSGHQHDARVAAPSGLDTTYPPLRRASGASPVPRRLQHLQFLIRNRVSSSPRASTPHLPLSASRRCEHGSPGLGKRFRSADALAFTWWYR